MKYMGSKNRITKEILPIILKDRLENQVFVEPFCGGLGTMDKVGGVKIANDKNKYLIAMWEGLQENHKRPYHISKELYSNVRNRLLPVKTYCWCRYNYFWLEFQREFDLEYVRVQALFNKIIGAHYNLELPLFEMETTDRSCETTWEDYE